ADVISVGGGPSPPRHFQWWVQQRGLFASALTVVEPFSNDGPFLGGSSTERSRVDGCKAIPPAADLQRIMDAHDNMVMIETSGAGLMRRQKPTRKS
ncbi:MAG: hypothetical protein ABW128_23275, partial [Rhizorhabdus sp.]